MVIGLLILDLHIPLSHSLKEKRKRLNRFRDRIRNKHNVAFAELDHHDKWQRSLMGILTINREKKIVEQRLQRIIQEAEDHIDGEILSSEISYI